MKISLIVPVFNEEDTIDIFYRTVREQLSQYEVEIVFVNDGSVDNTKKIITALTISDPLVTSLCFTRNFGKEPALFAGLEASTGDAVIPIDVDFRTPSTLSPDLLKSGRTEQMLF